MRYGACKSDAGVYVKAQGNIEKSYILVYVDDLLIVSMGMDEIN